MQFVAGDGGVGKSQLATAVFSAASEADIQLRVWVDASTRASIVSALAAASIRLRLPVEAPGDADQAAAAFIDWAATTEKSWLVVFDDVTDPAHVVKLWPRGSAGWVLATTRNRDLQTAGARKVPVGVFTPAESLAYLTEKLSGPDAEACRTDVLEQAADLADDLGHLPLALAQAAAVIAFDAGTCAEYRTQFANRSLKLGELFPANASADEYTRTVASAWSLAIERADRQAPVGMARAVLETAAFLNPNGIPSQIWKAPALLKHIETRLADFADTSSAARELTFEDVKRGLRNLHRFSLLTYRPSAADGVALVRMHGLVQRAVLDELPETTLAVTARAAADGLLAIWPSVENDTAAAAVLRQNAATLGAQHAEALWEGGAHPLLFRIGRSFGDAGQLTSAISATEQLLEECVARLGADHSNTLATRSNLAFWRGTAGDAAGAVADFDKLLADRIRVLGPNHPDTLRTRNNLAGWRGEAGDAAGAVTEFEKVLTDRLRVLGPEHPDTLRTRGNVASWRGTAGNTAGAIIELETLLTDYLRVLGPEHPETLRTRNNFAASRGTAGDTAGAITEFEKLLTDQLRVLGPDHPDTLTTRNNLAGWRGEAGDTAGAITEFEKLLTDQLRVLGPDHPDTLRTRNNLARSQQRSAG